MGIKPNLAGRLLSDHDLLIKQTLVAIAYVITGYLGLMLPFAGSHITLVWLPTGIAVAALIRWGWGMSPAIYIAALLVNLIIGSSFGLAASIAIGNTAGPMLVAWWLLRAGFHPEFDRRRDVGLLVFTACVGMTLSATGGVINLQLAGLLEQEAMAKAWMSWWMGDAVGVLLAAPLLLTFSRDNTGRLVRDLKVLSLWLAIALPLAWLAFSHDVGTTEQSLALTFLSLPMFVWAALSFGITGASLAALLFSFIAAVSTATGNASSSPLDMHSSLLLLWSYMAAAVLTGLLVTALLAERLHAEMKLRISEEKLRGLYELSPLGIAIVDMQGRFIEFNEAFSKVCGYPTEELQALDFWKITPERYIPEDSHQLAILEDSGFYGPYEKEYIRKDGSHVPVRLNGMLIKESGQAKYIWSIVEDISDRKRLDADLSIAATAFDAQVGIIVTDADGIIIKVNRSFEENSGFSAEEILGHSPRMFRSGRHGADFYTEMWDRIRRDGVWLGEIWDKRKNGEIYPKWMTITAVKDSYGVTTNYVATQFDISDKKAQENEIKLLAFYDPLTGLPNRRHLFERLQQALPNCSRHHRRGALLFIDLDNFKTLNETLGHDRGDILLQQAARRLITCVREGDTVARLGGDEFVVMLEDLSENHEEAGRQAEAVGQKIVSILQNVYLLDGHDHHSSASVGITLFGEQSANMEELLKQADLAMYKAKSSGRNALRFFDPEMQAQVSKRVGLEKDLRNAINDGQFVLHYQAQVDGDLIVRGAEVLVRWQHPERGLVYPDHFIHFAEETGLILPLGRFVLETACAQLSKWAHHPDTSALTLAVNVSANQLREKDFVEQVLAILEYHGTGPTKLKLELTESLLMSDAEDTIAKMAVLKAKGIGFALDDFGTGFSSLSYLKRLPLEKLKIDRSFVMDVLTDPNDAAIAKTIIVLAQSMGLGVIAEGVETEGQRAFLAANGCHRYQGYLFGKPVPLENFERDLRQREVEDVSS